MTKITQRPRACLILWPLRDLFGETKATCQDLGLGLSSAALQAMAFSISPRHLPVPALGQEPDTFLRPPQLPELTEWRLRKGLSKAETS